MFPCEKMEREREKTCSSSQLLFILDNLFSGNIIAIVSTTQNFWRVAFEPCQARGKTGVELAVVLVVCCVLPVDVQRERAGIKVDQRDFKLGIYNAFGTEDIKIHPWCFECSIQAFTGWKRRHEAYQKKVFVLRCGPLKWKERKRADM